MYMYDGKHKKVSGKSMRSRGIATGCDTSSGSSLFPENASGEKTHSNLEFQAYEGLVSIHNFAKLIDVNI